MMCTFPPSLSFHVSSDPSWGNEVPAKHKMYKVVKTILQKDLCQLNKKFSCSYLVKVCYVCACVLIYSSVECCLISFDI